MTTPLPPIHDTPAALPARLTAEREAQKPQRFQALSRLQTPHPAPGGPPARGQACGRRALAGRVCAWRPAPAAHQCQGPRPSAALVSDQATSPPGPPEPAPRLCPCHSPWAVAAPGLWRAPGLHHGAPVRARHPAGATAGAADSAAQNTLKRARLVRHMLPPSGRRHVPRASPCCRPQLSALCASAAWLHGAVGGGRGNDGASR
jgi:hypothetical protein